MKTGKMRKVFSGLGVLVALLVVGPAQAALFQVTVDTTPLIGQSAALGFDFTNGGVPSNSVTISGLSMSSDGAIGSAAYLTTDNSIVAALPLATPTTPVVLSDAGGALFVEFLQYVTLGTSFTFTFSPSENLVEPTADTFLFYILVGDPPPPPPDLLPLLVLAPTNPDGTDALVRYEIGVTDPAQPQWYLGETMPSDGSSPEPIGVTVTATAVPEPGALVLAIAGLLALGAARPVRTMRLPTLSST